MTDLAADRAPVLDALRQAINEMKSAGHLSPEPLAVAAALRELRHALAKCPGTASQLTHKAAFSDSLARLLSVPTQTPEAE